MDMVNYDFDAVYAYLVEKFYFLREDYIKADLEDIINYEEEDGDIELNDTTLIEIFSNRFFGRMCDGYFVNCVEDC